MDEIFKECDLVCFDFDSTIIRHEGINLLAKFKGVHDVITKLTNAAMGEDIDYQKTLEDRLNIIQPTEIVLDKVSKDISFFDLSSGIITLLKDIRYHKKKIAIISGGFERMIKPYFKIIGEPDYLFCNKLEFDMNGKYNGFDKNRPTSKSFGKVEVIKKLSENYKNIIMIGDGKTDLETKDYVMCFIGYGGNKAREIVKTNAEYYYTDFRNFLFDIRNQWDYF